MQGLKDLHFGQEATEKLVSGITKISKAVKSTLGPAGQTVLIESPEHLHGMTVTKDGVTVAKSISLVDPVEDLAVRMIREAASRTAKSSGDGTTTSVVLAEALVNSGLRKISQGLNKTEVLRHLVSETKSIGKTLKLSGKKLDVKGLRNIATISANNDKFIGGIIADAHSEVGDDGVVSIEKSQDTNTHYEVTEGIKVDRGFTSELFVNNHKRDECIMNDVYVMVCDSEIGNWMQIEKVLEPIIKGRKNILIIAPCSSAMVNTLAANVVKNKLGICNIIPPDFGYRKSDLMADIALSVGATNFSEATGDSLSLMTFDDLGHCSKVIVGRDYTVIVRDEGVASEEIKQKVAELRESKDTAKDKKFVDKRIASLSAASGVIYVGGNTDLEQKELYDRVEDAVCAVESAATEGILPGGGLALYNIHKSYVIKAAKEEDAEKKAAFEILDEALKAPLYQILENAGLDAEEIYSKCKSGPTYGYNVKTNKYGYMTTMGVIDPVKVTRQALQNAVSVAVTILSTNAIITMARA